MKKPSPKARGKAPRPIPFKNNKVDFSKFKTKFSAVDIAKLAGAGVGTKVWPVTSIDQLSPTKTVGRGPTGLNLITASLLWTDATTPFVGLSSGLVQVNFEPIAYGITSVVTYVITFNIETFGAGTTFKPGRLWRCPECW